jgi:fibronectin type 3 domain-containing protein
MKPRTSTAGVQAAQFKYAKVAVIIVLVGLVCVQPNHAQQVDEMRTTVRLAARTGEQQHVQLRLFPDRRELMRFSLADGFVLERRSPNSNFSEIARIRTYDEAAWRTMIASESDAEQARDIGLAFIFQQSLLQTQGGTLNFDNGISDLEELKSREEFAYFAFLVSSLKSADIAEALGLSYTDTQVQLGQTYIYRVRPVQLPDDYDYVATDIEVTVGSADDAYANEVDVFEGDGILSFSWQDSDNISGILVERRTTIDEAFVPLMDQPLFSLQSSDPDQPIRSSFADSNVVNYTPYTYRFMGYNLFGEVVPFAEITAVPRDRTPPEAPFMPVPEQISAREVKISWTMNEVPASDLLGFVVGRSNRNEGDFGLLHSDFLPKETRSFIDTTFVPGQLNYYVVQAVDTALNVSSSFPMAVTLIDSIPPAKPVILTSTIDSTGVVTLQLQRNTDPDLMGFRLYRSNDPDHEFTHVLDGFSFGDTLTSNIQTVFSDTVTLNTLTPKVYYKAEALDFNYNASEFSDVLSVSRPDTIPPSVPVIYNVISQTDRIELYYHSSESTDLARQELYRKTSLDVPWAFFDTLSASQNMYIDRNVTQGTKYYYSMRAIDRSDLYSDYAFAVYGLTYDDGVRPAVETIRAQIDGTTLRLDWEYDQKDWEVYFVVYRQNTDGILVQHARTDQPTFSETLPPGSRIVYSVRAYTSDGGQSPLSAEIVVVVE